MSFTNTFQLFTSPEIESLRKNGKILRECLQYVAACVRPGITTMELDEAAERFIRDAGGVPAFKGYRGFPCTLCTSVNDAVVHGIPSVGERLKDGDIISIDCGVILDDLYTDACVSVGVGTISKEAEHFLGYVSQTLEDVIAEVVRAGAQVGDISSFIETQLKKGGYRAVKVLTGHGLGATLHQFPDIPNVGKAGTGPKLPVGTMIAIEPIAVMGKEDVMTGPDNWTIFTKDHSLACHFEHSVLITEQGCKVIA